MTPMYIPLRDTQKRRRGKDPLSLRTTTVRAPEGTRGKTVDMRLDNVAQRNTHKGEEMVEILNQAEWTVNAKS